MTSSWMEFGDFFNIFQNSYRLNYRYIYWLEENNKNPTDILYECVH